MTADNGTFQSIFSSLIDGLILVSSEGVLLQGNLASEEMFRQSSASFCGKPINEFFLDQPDVVAKILDTACTGVSFRDVDCLGYRRGDPNPFPASLTLSPFIGPNHILSGALLHVRDRSLAQELEETSRQMDQISRLGVLSLGMAHEIKNPLVAISGSAQLLRSRLPDDEHREYLDVVIKEVGRINRLVERMLDLAHKQPINLQPINIHRLLEEILILEREDPRYPFEVLYDPSLPTIPGDWDQLKQVFLNLIRNAKEAMPEGGPIQVITRFRSDYAIRTRNRPNPHQDIIVEIVDRGSGIPEHHLSNLFVPFHTTKPKGSGLGLPISLKIVEDHHGKIKVISKEGMGTTVKVFLPLRQQDD